MVVLAASDSLKPQPEPQDLVFCAQPLDRWLAERGLSRADVVRRTRNERDLFEARLFAVEPSPSLLQGYVERPGPRVDGAVPRGAAAVAAPRSTSATTPSAARTAACALRRELLRESFRLRQGWREVSVGDFASSFAGPEWRETLRHWLARTDDALLRAYRERLYRAVALDEPTRRRAGRHRIRAARRRDGPAPPRSQGGPDRLGAGAAAPRPGRRLDRHAPLHAARGRTRGEPRRRPERPAADPGLLPPHGRAPRPRALDRPRHHRDLHVLRAAARLPQPGLAVRTAQGRTVPHGPGRGTSAAAVRCRRCSTSSAAAWRSRCCARCPRARASAPRPCSAA